MAKDKERAQSKAGRVQVEAKKKKKAEAFPTQWKQLELLSQHASPGSRKFRGCQRPMGSHCKAGLQGTGRGRCWRSASA